MMELDPSVDPGQVSDAATTEEGQSDLPVEVVQEPTRRKMPQRQRRKAGNLARLVAKRVEEEAEALQKLGLLQGAGAKRKRRRSPDAHSDAVLPELLTRKGRLPDVLERGASIAERRLVARRIINPLRNRGRTPLPRIVDLFDKKGDISRGYPTKNELHKMRATERQYRAIARKRRAEEEARAKTAGAEPSTTKSQKKQRRLNLPPFFERMKGSGWADRLPLPKRQADSSAGNGPSREERAARRYKGGHVMLHAK